MGTWQGLDYAPQSFLELGVRGIQRISLILRSPLAARPTLETDFFNVKSDKKPQFFAPATIVLRPLVNLRYASWNVRLFVHQSGSPYVLLDRRGVCYAIFPLTCLCVGRYASLNTQ